MWYEKRINGKKKLVFRISDRMPNRIGDTYGSFIETHARRREYIMKCWRHECDDPSNPSPPCVQCGDCDQYEQDEFINPWE